MLSSLTHSDPLFISPSPPPPLHEDATPFLSSNICIEQLHSWKYRPRAPHARQGKMQTPALGHCSSPASHRCLFAQTHWPLSLTGLYQPLLVHTALVRCCSLRKLSGDCIGPEGEEWWSLLILLGETSSSHSTPAPRLRWGITEVWAGSCSCAWRACWKRPWVASQPSPITNAMPNPLFRKLGWKQKFQGVPATLAIPWNSTSCYCHLPPEVWTFLLSHKIFHWETSELRRKGFSWL